MPKSFDGTNENCESAECMRAPCLVCVRTKRPTEFARVVCRVNDVVFGISHSCRRVRACVALFSYIQTEIQMCRRGVTTSLPCPSVLLNRFELLLMLLLPSRHTSMICCESCRARTNTWPANAFWISMQFAAKAGKQNVRQRFIAENKMLIQCAMAFGTLLCDRRIVSGSLRLLLLR